ncbi:SOS response-associated peptidase family protein [Novosphingobium sp.]|uniref:SOS response-associated peptidase family protein n=1 Tax=Novosphingobium sp. TaxID=1874826 RepID=UPI0025E2913D|nr:SOS response-associated peptidase family protein [Novosphingobium sp.]
MTVLYRLDAPVAVFAPHFGAAAGDDPWQRGHVAPGGFAPVITAGREAIAGPRGSRQPRRLIPRRWGVPPPPSAGAAARAVLTVRNPDSPFWIGNLRNSEFRCLVPATSMMEWGRVDPATNKRRQHWLGCTDQPLFALAGVWKDSEVPSFALLTCEANAAWRDLGRDAMPAILPPDPAVWRSWLNADWQQAARLIAPYSSSLLHEIGRTN